MPHSTASPEPEPSDDAAWVPEWFDLSEYDVAELRHEMDRWQFAQDAGEPR